MGGAFDIGAVSKAKEDWVLATTARIEGKLHGFMFSTLERIGGTPCVLIGMLSVRRHSKRDTVLRGLMHEAYHRALMAFPDEDVVDRLTVRGRRRARRLQEARRGHPEPRPPGRRRGAGRGRRPPELSAVRELARPSSRARPGRDEPVRHWRRCRAGVARIAAASTSGCPIPDVEFDKGDRLRSEKEMLGLYVSDHPLFGVETALRRKVEQLASPSSLDLDDGAHARSSAASSPVSSASSPRRATRWPCSCSRTSTASIEVTVFPRTLAEQGHKLVDDVIVTVKGRLDRRDESRFGLIAQDDHRCWRVSPGRRAPSLRLATAGDARSTSSRSIA